MFRQRSYYTGVEFWLRGGWCRGKSTWEKLPTDQLQIKGSLCSLQKAGCVGEGSVTVYIFQEWLADLLVEYDLQGDPLSLLYQQDLSAVIMLVLVWKEVDQNVENTLVPGVLSYFFPTFYSYVYPFFLQRMPEQYIVSFLNV